LPLSVPVEGHSRNQACSYVFARRLVEDSEAQEGWLPASCLEVAAAVQGLPEASNGDSGTGCESSSKLAEEGLDLESSPVAFLGA
jgi:hypothetical protein